MDETTQEPQEKTLREKTVDDILAIAKRVKKKTTPDNFEVVFKEILRIIYPV